MRWDFCKTLHKKAAHRKLAALGTPHSDFFRGRRAISKINRTKTTGINYYWPVLKKSWFSKGATNFFVVIGKKWARYARRNARLKTTITGFAPQYSNDHLSWCGCGAQVYEFSTYEWKQHSLQKIWIQSFRQHFRFQRCRWNTLKHIVKMNKRTILAPPCLAPPNLRKYNYKLLSNVLQCSTSNCLPLVPF